MMRPFAIVGSMVILTITEKVANQMLGLPRDSWGVFAAMGVSFWVGAIIAASFE
jgi:hypothetical protein